MCYPLRIRVISRGITVRPERLITRPRAALSIAPGNTLLVIERVIDFSDCLNVIRAVGALSKQVLHSRKGAPFRVRLRIILEDLAGDGTLQRRRNHVVRKRPPQYRVVWACVGIE